MRKSFFLGILPPKFLREFLDLKNPKDLGIKGDGDSDSGITATFAPRANKNSNNNSSPAMDPSKLVPSGSVRLHAVLTLRNKGDVADVKEDLRKVFAHTHK